MALLIINIFMLIFSINSALHTVYPSLASGDRDISIVLSAVWLAAFLICMHIKEIK